VSVITATLRVGVFTVLPLSMEQEKEIDAGGSATVAFLRRFLKICRLVQRLWNAVAALHCKKCNESCCQLNVNGTLCFPYRTDFRGTQAIL